MATPYNHKAIEKKWRENWEKNPVNVKSDENGKREKYYCLDMFPYPSGNGLHVGHWRGYVICFAQPPHENSLSFWKSRGTVHRRYQEI